MIVVYVNVFSVVVVSAIVVCIFATSLLIDAKMSFSFVVVFLLVQENDAVWRKNAELRNQVLRLTASLVGKKMHLKQAADEFSW